MADEMVSDVAEYPISPTALRKALGQFPTGVAIVTAADAEGAIGMTANSFASVSLSPPLVLWSVAKSAMSHDRFVAADAFAIHFLGADHHDLAVRFADRGGDKFTEIGHRPGLAGSPLIERLAPIFECRAWARHPGGDHTILVGEVIRLVERVHDPLVFHSGVLRRIEAHPRPAPKLASDSFARNYLAYLLARASFTVSSDFHATLKNWGLTVPEWRVLACLIDVEGLSVGELAEMALMKQPALTKVLDRMESDGLLTRRAATEDRRRVTIHSTQKGRKRAEPVRAAAKQHESELLQSFTDQQRAIIKHALDLLISRSTSPNNS